MTIPASAIFVACGIPLSFSKNDDYSNGEHNRL